MIAFQFDELIRAFGSTLSKWTQSEMPQFIFELVYSNELETKFQSIADSHGVLLAYHGSSVENFHSIIHNGLLNLFNKVLVIIQVGNFRLVHAFLNTVVYNIHIIYYCMSLIKKNIRVV